MTSKKGKKINQAKHLHKNERRHARRHGKCEKNDSQGTEDKIREKPASASFLFDTTYFFLWCFSFSHACVCCCSPHFFSFPASCGTISFCLYASLSSSSRSLVVHLACGVCVCPKKNVLSSVTSSSSSASPCSCVLAVSMWISCLFVFLPFFGVLVD